VPTFARPTHEPSNPLKQESTMMTKPSHRLASSLILACIGAGMSPAHAAVNCTGRINDMYKWSNLTSISVRLQLDDGRLSNWITMPTRADEVMALMAFGGAKPVLVYWSAGDVTTCNDGWTHNRSLDGYFLIRQ
jgi:hypothetical protein